MLQNIRRRVAARLAGEESGFTLIELLVVMLILGILAAIALPAFFNQKEKAGDAKAKEYAHTAQVAMETYSTENSGSYEGATVSKLETIEPTISSAKITISVAKPKEYEFYSESSNTDKFYVKSVSGKLTFKCEPEKTGGCPAKVTGASQAEWGS